MKFSRLTPPAIKKMKVGEELREHQVKVLKLDGDERWTVEFMFHRTRVHRVLGLSSEGWTRTLCETRIQQIKAEILAGTSSLPKGRKTHLRLRDVADWYLDEMEATGGKNLIAKRRHVTQRLKPAFGDILPEKLNEGDLGRYVKARLDEGAEAGTVNRELATLSHMLSTALDRRKLLAPPCRIRRLKEELTPRTPLTDADLAKLRQAAREDVAPRLWLFVEFAMDTSMRQSEVGRARFCDVQWDKRRLILWRAKGGRRYQPLSDRLVKLLAEERQNRPEEDRDGWIFPASTKTGHVLQFNSRFSRAVVAAGLSPDCVTPHLLRHSAVTRLAERGIGVATIQKISGHKTAAMVMRYTHIADSNVHDAMRVLEEANGELADYTGITQAGDKQAAA
jgi:integrase